MNILSIFDTDEQIAVNAATANELLKNFSKADLMKRIKFIRAISKDEEVQNLYEGLHEKVS